MKVSKFRRIKIERFNVHTTKIDYAIEWEDLPECETEEEFEKEKAKILKSLPQELDLEVECDKEELEDTVIDMITERTNWLICGAEYTVK